MFYALTLIWLTHATMEHQIILHTALLNDCIIAKEVYQETIAQEDKERVKVVCLATKDLEPF